MGNCIYRFGRSLSIKEPQHREFDAPFEFGAFMYFAWPIVLPYYLVKTQGVEGLVLFMGFVFSIVCILFMSSKRNGILADHEYTLTEEGLFEKTIANECLSKWEGNLNVLISGGYLFIQINGYLFHTIPSRYFTSKAEFNEYASALKGYWKHAHSK